MKRWKCVCAYDGSHFSGWQSQTKRDSVQDVVESRLAVILGIPTRIYGSGRTDSGVHAKGQVFHFDAEWVHGPDKLAAALRYTLSEALQIISVRPVRADFHARFSATRKEYSYHIHLGDADPFTRPYCWTVFKPLNLEAMKAAATVLIGKHDFRAFSALNGVEDPENNDTVRTLAVLDVRRRGRELRIQAAADGFLYKMVRSLVGALVAVGEGKLNPQEIKNILNSKTRTAQVHTAPAHGLFLQRVYYR
jgi:tRNA pseudouridine38-40 synthase